MAKNRFKPTGSMALASGNYPIVPKTNYDPHILPHHGEAPCFRDFTDMNGVTMSDNNHPEGEYEHHARLPHFGPHKTEMSEMVQGQVIRMDRGKSMSFNSFLRPANPGHAGDKEEEE